MRWDRRKRKYWDVGEKEPFFRPSKDRSQRFLEALIRCDGELHDSVSLFVRDGEYDFPNMKIHQIDVVFRISLPEGAESLFEEIMDGMATLSEPVRVQVN